MIGRASEQDFHQANGLFHRRLYLDLREPNADMLDRLAAAILNRRESVENSTSETAPKERAPNPAAKELGERPEDRAPDKPADLSNGQAGVPASREIDSLVRAFVDGNETQRADALARIQASRSLDRRALAARLRWEVSTHYSPTQMAQFATAHRDPSLFQVVRCGAKVVARHVQIPRSTASTWRRRGLRPVVTTEPFDQETQYALDSSARWQKRARALAAVLRLLLALLRASGFSLTGKRLHEGQAKAGILRTVTSAEAFLPLAIILRILGQESGRYHAWRRAEKACELTDRSSCPRTSPGQLTATEVATIKNMVLAPEYRHMPLGTLARLLTLRSSTCSTGRRHISRR